MESEGAADADAADSDMSRGDGKASRAREIGGDDLALASRIKAARAYIGVTQRALAAAIGVSLGQIQKYEHGSDRISIGQLFEIERALGLPRFALFNPAANWQRSLDDAALLRAFHRIEDAGLRSAFMDMVEAVAASGDESSGFPVRVAVAR